ncbi:MAG: hypothetical protein QOH62_3828 [Solirubrobacteraceae bacterium]|nr:hypothetical protein [Solirubrobacteraceae bacterium]
MASETVTTGSKHETMLAVEGPTRSSPSRNVLMGRIVDTSTIPAMSSQPCVDSVASIPPCAMAAIQNVPAAPVVTIALSRNGSSFPTTVSATRM